MRSYNLIQEKARDSWLYSALDKVLYSMIEGGDSFETAVIWAVENFDFEGVTTEEINNQKALVLTAFTEWEAENV